MSNDLQALPTTPAKAPARKGKAPPAPEGSAKALNEFAAANLPKLDRVFLDFFNSYDQYRTDLAAWQARYEPTTPAIDPAGAPAAMGSPSTPICYPDGRRCAVLCSGGDAC